MMDTSREQDLLLPIGSNDLNSHQQGSWAKRALFAVSVVSIGAFAFSSSQHSKPMNSSTSLIMDTTISRQLSANKLNYDELPKHTLNVYGADMIVEPNVENVLTLSSCEDCKDLIWEIVPINEGEKEYQQPVFDHSVSTNSISVQFNEPNAKFLVTVSLKNNDGGENIILSKLTASVKYVRREIRSLSDKDRTKYFRALKTIFTVSQEDGMALYGDKFLSSGHLIGLHDSNEYKYHANLFFLTSHPAMQIKCENSLLSIDSTTALPYWDFLIDTSLGREWASSPLYKDDWFGPVKTSKLDNYRVTGTFHDVKYVMDKDWSKYPNSYHTPFGFLGVDTLTIRTEHLQRSNTYCGFESVQGQVECTSVKTCFDTFESVHNLREFDECLEYNVHANLHTMHSGQWDCKVDLAHFYDVNEKWLDEMLLSIMGVRSASFTTGFYRDQLVKCPLTCESDEICACMSKIDDIVEVGDVDDVSEQALFEYMKDSWKAIGSTAVGGSDYVKLQKKYIVGSITHKDVFVPINSKKSGDHGDKVGEAVSNAKLMELNTILLKMVLFPGTTGIMVSGAAANDPLFWVMHPLFDKAVHALRLSPKYNQEGFEWNNKEGDMTWEGTTPFSRLDFEPYLADHKINQDPLTNKELWSFLHPQAETIAYVYDQFTTWGGCDFDPF